MPATDEYTTLEDCEIEHATKLALLVRHEGKKHWLPKSEIDDPERLEVGDKGVTIIIPDWLAEEKGIK